MKIVLTLQIPWNVPEEPSGFPRHLLRTTDLAHVTVLRIREVQKHMTHLMLSVSEKRETCTQVLTVQLSTGRVHGPVLSECQETVILCARKEGKKEDATKEKLPEHCLERELRLFHCTYILKSASAQSQRYCFHNF